MTARPGILVAALLLLLSHGPAAFTQESPARLVRNTEALTPAEELAKLRVPAGFEVQLFAAEPMINKPINLAFDERGRLWVSSTVEYPYAAPTNRWSDAQGSRVRGSRDAIKILEDTDGDGRADKATDFADGLNIPTGVLPWHRPEHRSGCIAWSIPNIWYFADTDGDGKCDLRQVLFGPLGYERDTHGMCSSFRPGLDGWVYATHGFNNTSHFKVRPENLRGAKPGDPGTGLTLNSGNVFRFRPDGSRIEIWSWGQVNPFGLCFDARGSLYGADCHSAPIYQLLQGAFYPSFGKPDDGLGFGPTMMTHQHGSTGICGLEYIDSEVWGAPWNHHMLVGNPVTSRVNHDTIVFRGSTPVAREETDFVISDDLWFRPVDLRLGPDGALYIADFYNRIIGHYEVPLDHPGRDRERGRIWRIVYHGSGGTSYASPTNPKSGTRVTRPSDTTALPADADGLINELMSGNATRRSLAVNQLLRHTSEQTFATLDQAATGLWHFRSKDDRTGLMTGALWVLHQQGRLGEATLLVALKDRDELVRVHALRVLAERGPARGAASTSLANRAGGHPSGVNAALLSAAVAALKDDDAHVQRAAAAALQQHPALESLQPLLALFASVPTEDTHLRHGVRMALREQLNLPGALTLFDAWLHGRNLSAAVRADLVSITDAVATPEAAAYIFSRLKSRTDAGPEALLKNLPHVARYSDASTLAEELRFARERFAADNLVQVDAVQAIHNGLAERGASANEALLAWAQDLAQQLLASLASAPTPDWLAAPLDEHKKSDNPWVLQQRKCADGQEVTVISSLDLGARGAEQRTGVLRSKNLKLPAKLGFWLCGHRGSPGQPAHDKNFVRLVDAATGTTLKQAFPPRNDTCRRIEWDLSTHAGQEARIEVVDGDNGSAYAWLGVTRFEPPVVSVERFAADDRTRKALRALAEILRFTAPVGLRDQLAAFLPSQPAPVPAPVSAEERAKLDGLIRARAGAFVAKKRDTVRGAAVFTEHCAGCHRISANGGLIGPQLDGIGNRGVERLCEDILDPNRNVDSHFFLHLFKLRDGTTLGGFVRGEAGQVLLIADANGQEQRVAMSDIVEDNITPMSLMSPVFAQTIPENDFHDLLAFLLSNRQDSGGANQPR